MDIIGNASISDKEYFDIIKKDAKILVKNKKVNFLGSIPNHKVAEVYNKNKIVLNMTNSGSFDKTIIEAMACENVILISNNSFRELIPKKYHNLLFFKEDNKNDLAKKIIKLLKLNEDEEVKIGKELRNKVVNYHSLKKLEVEVIKYL